MDIDCPELQDEAGGNNEEPDKASQNAKRNSDPIVRDGKILEDE